MPIRRSGPNLVRASPWLRLAVVIAVLGVGLYGTWQRQQNPQQGPNATVPQADHQGEVSRDAFDDAENGSQAAAKQSPDNPAGRKTVAPQTIRDQNGRIVFRGDVDVGSTIGRIDRGERLEYAHDGIVFQNRERRLPQKPAGYYREYVHPTPGVFGPGPQRIVRGRNGETYYTPDHYLTFQRLGQ